jgi:hypothetical protein
MMTPEKIALIDMDGTLSPISVRVARAAIEDWERYGVCPNMRNAKLACTWTCLECKQERDATVGSVSTEDYGRSRVRGPDAPQGVQCALFKRAACAHLWETVAIRERIGEYGTACALCGTRQSERERP